MCAFVVTSVMYVSSYDIHCLLVALLIKSGFGYVSGPGGGGGFLHGGADVDFNYF